MAKLYGGTDVDSATDIAIGPNTNCYLTGIIRSTNLVFGSTTLSATGETLFGDIFVAHLNNSGNAVAAWTVQGTAQMPVRVSPWISSGIVTSRVFSKARIWCSFRLVGGGNAHEQ
ncbi:MAG: hypothetical protein WDM76_14445 [Limisphaerales bacterium]